MGVNLRCLHALVTEQLLHGPDIRSAFEEVGRERVPENVRSDAFVDVRLTRSPSDGVLESACAAIGLPGRRWFRATGISTATPSVRRHLGIFVPIPLAAKRQATLPRDPPRRVFAAGPGAQPAVAAIVSEAR